MIKYTSTLTCKPIQVNEGAAFYLDKKDNNFYISQPRKKNATPLFTYCIGLHASVAQSNMAAMLTYDPKANAASTYTWIGFFFDSLQK